MKTIKTSVLFALVCGIIHAQTPISPYIYGQNLWYYPLSPTTLTTTVKNSAAKTMRVGGIFWDNYATLPSNGIPPAPLMADLQYTVAMINSLLMLPIVQIPVGTKSVTAQHYNQTCAENILMTLNYPSSAATNTMLQTVPASPYCRHWMIGNEWDGHNQTNSTTSPDWNAGDAAGKIKTYGLALRTKNYNPYNNWFKNSNPIYIVGPELTRYNTSWIPTFTTSPNNLLATVTNPIPNQSSVPSVDYFTWHCYAMGDEGRYRDGAVGNTTATVNYFLKPNRFNTVNNITLIGENYVKNNQTYASPYDGIKKNISDFQAGHPGVKLAITETNIDYANDVGLYDPATGTQTKTSSYDAENGPSTDKTDDSYTGNGTNSFLAGQWWAEMLAMGMEKQLFTVDFWSIKEGANNSNPPVYDRRPYKTNCGYLDAISGNTKSTYYHFQAMAKYMQGTFVNYTTKTQNGFGGNSARNFKVFASKSCNYVTVMAMNQNKTGSLPNNINAITIDCNNSLPNNGYFRAAINLFPAANQRSLSASGGGIKEEETIMWIMDACGNLLSTFRFHYNSSSSVTPTYTTPNLTAPTAGCSCAKASKNNSGPVKVITSLPGNLRCANSGYTGDSHFNDAILANSITIKDTAWVTGTLTVPNGITLTIDSTLMILGEGAKIMVEAGGKLVISESHLTGCVDEPTTWSGIEVTGTNSNIRQVDIQRTAIMNAVNSLKLTNTNDIYVTECSFNNGQTGIEMTGCKGFRINDNEFLKFDKGLVTENTISETAYITQNIFYDVNYGFYSHKDDHDQLNVNCNGFHYTAYGIYADTSDFKDQGSATYGAGNIFISESGETNNQFRYNGAAMTYYTDPSLHFDLILNPDLTATSTDATNDQTCPEPASRIAAMVNENKKFYSSRLLSCNPNPVSGNAQFAYRIENNQGGEIVVKGVLGNEVARYEVPAGSTAANINLTALPNGVYFAYLFVNNQKINTIKIVKTN